jgi:hypothetical protein
MKTYYIAYLPEKSKDLDFTVDYCQRYFNKQISIAKAKPKTLQDLWTMLRQYGHALRVANPSYHNTIISALRLYRKENRNPNTQVVIGRIRLPSGGIDLKPEVSTFNADAQHDFEPKYRPNLEAMIGALFDGIGPHVMREHLDPFIFGIMGAASYELENYKTKSKEHKQ